LNPGKATIQIQSTDNFEWLSTKYKTTLRIFLWPLFKFLIIIHPHRQSGGMGFVLYFNVLCYGKLTR
jgi:hypothetical protein